MKRLKITLLLFLLSNLLYAQDMMERIASEACDCIDLVSLSKADSCITSSMAKVVSSVENKEETTFLGTVEGIKGALTQVHQLVQENCSSYRTQFLEQRKEEFYRVSENKRADRLYQKGTEKMKQGDYKKAAKDFKKALRIDPQFVMAWDHLAVCYRQLQQYDKAITYYEKSLALFPEGDLALLNMAVLYSLKKESKIALAYYTTLRDLYPDNPEGYFGVAKESLLTNEMEQAAENALIAYILYQSSGSSYLKDGEQLLGLIYNKLKEQNRIQLLEEKAKELNITLTIN